MNKYGQIYLISNNFDNKVYIGQTTQKLNLRFKAHYYYAKYNTHKFAKAINCYKIDNFKIKSLRYCADKEELDYYETLYINLFDSASDKGYNSTLKASGSGLHSVESKEKMSYSRSGNPFYCFNL